MMPPIGGANSRLPPRRAAVHQQAPTQPKTKLKCLVLGATSAGKTSILRRYFYGNFEGNRVPTLGSDWYTKRLTYRTPSTGGCTVDDSNRQDESVSISLQLWDTPGRERLDAKRPGGQHQQQQPSLQASFLQQADAYMLVYDVTSSTSFKQLLKWYTDLVKLFETAAKQDNCSSKLPILVVGTKVDLLQRGLKGSSNSQDSGSPQRRNILGLRDRDWRGRDYQYEYQVSKTEQPDHDEMKQVATRQDSKRMEIASYLADRENWTTDWGYLDGLLSSEDGSHPDRDMVVLWCKRNNLNHMEASAATGQGVDDVVVELVKLAMETKQEREEQSQPLYPQADKMQSSLATKLRHDRKLDLHQRYAPKGQRCCAFCWRGRR